MIMTTTAALLWISAAATGENLRVDGTAGNSTFSAVFDAPLGTSRTDRKVNFDKAADFNVKADSFWLDNSVFEKLGSRGSEDHPAKLKKAFFEVGEQADDRNDYLIYNSKVERRS